MDRKNTTHLIFNTPGTSFTNEIEGSIGKEVDDEPDLASRAGAVLVFDIIFEESLMMRSAFNPDFHSSPKRETCNTFKMGTV